jgi:cell division protein ZapA
MGNVTLTVNGRQYAISCDDGQERRVMELGHFIDKRLREIARGAGAVSEQHLMVLTSLLMADELFDSKARVEELEEQATAPGAPAINATPKPANDPMEAEREAHMADMITALARKIEAVSSQLEKAQASA